MTLPWQLILCAKYRLNPHSRVRVTFARAACDKKCKCCAGRRPNKLTDQLAVINRRRGDSRVGYSLAQPCYISNIVQNTAASLDDTDYVRPQTLCHVLFRFIYKYQARRTCVLRHWPDSLQLTNVRHSQNHRHQHI